MIVKNNSAGSTFSPLFMWTEVRNYEAPNKYLCKPSLLISCTPKISKFIYPANSHNLTSKTRN